MGIRIQNGGGMVRTDSGGGQKMPLVLFRVRDYNFLTTCPGFSFHRGKLSLGSDQWLVPEGILAQRDLFQFRRIIPNIIGSTYEIRSKTISKLFKFLVSFFPPYIFHIYYYRCSLNGLHVHDVRFPTQPRLGEVHMGSWSGSHRLEGKTPVFDR